MKKCARGHLVAQNDTFCPRCGMTVRDDPDWKLILWALTVVLVLVFLLLSARSLSRPNPTTQVGVTDSTVTKTAISNANLSTAITPTPVAMLEAPIAGANQTSTARAVITSSARQTASARSTALIQSTGTAVANRTAEAVAARTVAAQNLPATGQVTGAGLYVRSGPGTEYQPPISSLRQGKFVSIVGWNNATDGTRWWKIASPNGWVSSKFINASGCIDCVPRADRPPVPTPAPVPPTSTPVPVAAAPAQSALIATNRGPLLSQEQNGWSYQYEVNNTGSLALLSDRRMYNDIDCYIFPGEGDARLCADGELHPGVTGRVAYRWDSNYDGPVRMSVHAHKIDTSCGDGVQVRVFAGDRGQEPRELGHFSISGRDYVGRTEPYDLQISPSTFILVMVDIGGSSACDQARVFVDINRQ